VIRPAVVNAAHKTLGALVLGEHHFFPLSRHPVTCGAATKAGPESTAPWVIRRLLFHHRSPWAIQQVELFGRYEVSND
jgi:hypothetical protein